MTPNTLLKEDLLRGKCSREYLDVDPIPLTSITNYLKLTTDVYSKASLSWIPEEHSFIWSIFDLEKRGSRQIGGTLQCWPYKRTIMLSCFEYILKWSSQKRMHHFYSQNRCQIFRKCSKYFSRSLPHEAKDEQIFVQTVYLKLHDLLTYSSAQSPPKMSKTNLVCYKYKQHAIE